MSSPNNIEERVDVAKAPAVGRATDRAGVPRRRRGRSVLAEQKASSNLEAHVPFAKADDAIQQLIAMHATSVVNVTTAGLGLPSPRT